MSQEEEKKLLTLTEQFISALCSLDDLHKEPALRQMLLEIQWLRQNLASGKVIIPTKWQLLIFKPPAVLHQYSEPSLLARKLVFALGAYAFKSKVPPGKQLHS